MPSLTYTISPERERAGQQIGSTNFPLLGIGATAFGTLLAVNLIPEDPQPQGALFLPALVMAIAVASAPLAAALSDLKSILHVTHLLSLAPIYWLLLDLLQGSYALDGIPTAVVSLAFIGIGLFVITVWAAAWQRPWHVPAVLGRVLAQEFSGTTYFALAVMAFVLAMLKFAIRTNFDVAAMLYYVGQGRWAAPWGRGQLGGTDAFLNELGNFGLLLPTLTVIVANRAGWFNPRTFFSGVMAIIMAIFMAQSGSRRIIGVMFGMALITWLLAAQRLRVKHMLMLAIGVGALLAALQVMLEYRGVGLAALAEADEPILARGYLHVDDNFLRLCQIIDLIPQQYPHTYHQYVVWILVRPIPRLLWPGKPIDPGFDLPTAIGPTGASLSSTVIGELYMSGGFMAVALGGWLYGRLAAMASQLLTQRTSLSALLVYAIVTMSLFAGMRSMLDLVLVNYATVAWLSLVWLFRSARGNR
jgi:oligosaccharide repeat unit polymerase